MRALLLALALGALALPSLTAQTPGEDPRATALKQRIDRLLAEKVRALRAELHGVVDEAFRDGGADLDGLLHELEGGAPSRGEGPRTALPIVADPRLRHLRERLGSEHPEVLALEARQRTHELARKQPLMVLGLEGEPAGDGSWRVRAVRAASPAARAGVPLAGVLTRVAGLPLRSEHGEIPAALRIAAVRAANGLECDFEGRDAAGVARRWALPAAAPLIEEIDPEAMIERLGQRALERALPEEAPATPPLEIEAIDPKATIERLREGALRRALPPQLQGEIPPEPSAIKTPGRSPTPRS